jgi:mono/diheme cytochrome c family protein
VWYAARDTPGLSGLAVLRDALRSRVVESDRRDHGMRRLLNHRAAICRTVLLPLSAVVIALVPYAPGAVFGDQRAEIKNPFEGDSAAVEEGRQLYSRRCIFCHGTGGAGAKGSGLTGDRWKFGGSDAAVFDSIANGRPGTQMGAFGTSMTPEEIWKVIAYLRAQAHTDSGKN